MSKPSYVGAPQVFELELCCRQIVEAFDGFGAVYLVGSSIERKDWRDIDLRLIMSDGDFAKLFPDAGEHWEHDPRWLLMTCAISEWISKRTDLPIDFQFQPMTHANERHEGPRHAMGLHIKSQ
jgi:hypothetical protein